MILRTPKAGSVAQDSTPAWIGALEAGLVYMQTEGESGVNVHLTMTSEEARNNADALRKAADRADFFLQQRKDREKAREDE